MPKEFSELNIVGLILCAGQGKRAGLGYNKLLHYVGTKTILEKTLDRFYASSVRSVVLAVSPADYDAVLYLTRDYKGLFVCIGGDTRTDSVRAGLNAIGKCDIVVIHDGARPHVSAKIIDESIASAITYGSGIVAIPTVDTIKEVRNLEVVKSLVKSGLYNIQTPQTFVFERIAYAYSMLKGDYSDDCEIYEKIGFVPRIVVGSPENMKVTSNFDLMHPMQQNPVIGVGFDVHRLVRGRKLILGGSIIPFEKGLLGHSDADVLLHAIMDALLSAAGLPDIGHVFPDTDPKYKDANSMGLLMEVLALIRRRGFNIGNISAVIMAEQPKLHPFIGQMQTSIAKALGINSTQIAISATTTEQLGIIGNGKGIASSATCLLFK